MNKVNCIVNCSGKEVSNTWSTIGIIYFTFNWKDSPTQLIFGGKSQNFLKSLKFIDTALQKGDSVLVHSVRGQCRACCVILGYLIHKYNWSLEKSFEFLRSRRPDIDIRPNFLKQLMNFEETIRRKNKLSENWTGIYYLNIDRPNKSSR